MFALIIPAILLAAVSLDPAASPVTLKNEAAVLTVSGPSGELEARLKLDLEGLIATPDAARALGVELSRARRVRRDGRSVQIQTGAERLCVHHCADGMAVIAIEPRYIDHAVIGPSGFGPTVLDFDAGAISTGAPPPDAVALKGGRLGRLKLEACGHQFTARLDPSRAASRMAPALMARLIEAEACATERPWRTIENSPEIYELELPAARSAEAVFPQLDFIADPELGEAIDAVIGLHAMRRYAWWFDAEAAPVALQASQSESAPLYGLGLQLSFADRGLRVTAIRTGGPADGRLELDDRVVAINGVEPNSTNRSAFAAFFDTSTQRTLIFELERNGENVTHTLTSRPREGG
ncbi:MAG: hypothetical protein ACFE0P_09915 [Oceanicaulis sp.]